MEPRQPSAPVAARRLGGQVAVVTGASRGIGRAIALDARRAKGRDVVVNYARSRERGDAGRGARSLAGGGGPWPSRADVSRAEEVERLLGSTLESLRTVPHLGQQRGRGHPDGRGRGRGPPSASGTR